MTKIDFEGFPRMLESDQLEGRVVVKGRGWHPFVPGRVPHACGAYRWSHFSSGIALLCDFPQSMRGHQCPVCESTTLTAGCESCKEAYAKLPDSQPVDPHSLIRGELSSIVPAGGALEDMADAVADWVRGTPGLRELVIEALGGEALYRSKLSGEVYDYAETVRRATGPYGAGIAAVIRQTADTIGTMPRQEG